MGEEEGLSVPPPNSLDRGRAVAYRGHKRRAVHYLTRTGGSLDGGKDVADEHNHRLRKRSLTTGRHNGKEKPIPTNHKTPGLRSGVMGLQTLQALASRR